MVTIICFHSLHAGISWLVQGLAAHSPGSHPLLCHCLLWQQHWQETAKATAGPAAEVRRAEPAATTASRAGTAHIIHAASCLVKFKQLYLLLPHACVCISSPITFRYQQQVVYIIYILQMHTWPHNIVRVNLDVFCTCLYITYKEICMHETTHVCMCYCMYARMCMCICTFTTHIVCM